jgi:hypothetical protein
MEKLVKESLNEYYDYDDDEITDGPKIYGREILPEDALEELEDYTNEDSKVEVVRDPRVDGTFALQISRPEGKNKELYVFHLLWYRGGFDGVEFDKFPPTSKDLQFFT